MWGPSLIYESPNPTEFTRHAQWQCCRQRHFVSLIICTQKVKMWSLRQQNDHFFCLYAFMLTVKFKRGLYSFPSSEVIQNVIKLNDFRHSYFRNKNFVCWKNLPVLLWGSFFVWPLFGRTCWTCLNPPLTTKHAELVIRQTKFMTLWYST